MPYSVSHNATGLRGVDGKLSAAGGFFSKLRYVLPAIILSVYVQSALSQDETHYAVHANIVYHLTKYIDWPDAKKSGEFIIGVTGNPAMYEELKRSIADKMVGSQKISVKKVPASASSFDCHILFIGEDDSRHVKNIASKTAGSSVLLVTESEGLAQKGSCINFVVVSEHLKLEINKNNIEQRSLDIASELLHLGKVVK